MMGNQVMNKDEIRQMNRELWEPPVLNRAVIETKGYDLQVIRHSTPTAGVTDGYERPPYFSEEWGKDECTCGCTKVRGQLHHRHAYACAACGKLISVRSLRQRWPHARHLPEIM